MMQYGLFREEDDETNTSLSAGDRMTQSLKSMQSGKSTRLSPLSTVNMNTTMSSTIGAGSFNTTQGSPVMNTIPGSRLGTSTIGVGSPGSRVAALYDTHALGMPGLSTTSEI